MPAQRWPRPMSEREEFEHKNAEFDSQRAALLAKATDEANAERQRLLDEARKAADAQSARRQEALQTEARTLGQAIRRRTQQEVFAIARKALADLAAASLEERMADTFIRRLGTMDGKAKAGLADALKAASEPAVVRSAFELAPVQRTAIQKAINETFSGDFPFRSKPRPTWSAASSSRQTARRWPGASRHTSSRWRTASPTC